MPAHNNQVFVVCEAQTMKTQLNETGKNICSVFFYGDCAYKIDFQQILKIPMNPGLTKILLIL